MNSDISETYPPGKSIGTEAVNEYQKCIRVVQKFSIKKQESTVIGVAWFANKIYIFNDHRRIFIVSDKAPFNETVGEINFNEVVDPTDMVVCKVNRCIYISDGWGKCIYKIKLTNNPNYSNNRLEYFGSGIPQRMSVTPSAQLLIVAKDCCSGVWFIEETDPDNTTFEYLFDLPSNIEAVDHAVKVPSGNVIISYETQRFYTPRYLIGEMSVPRRKFLWRIDIRSTALPRLQQWFSSQIFVREDGEMFFAGVADDGREYRNHVFLFNQGDRELEELVSASQDSSKPMGFSFGQDNQQLVIYRMEWSRIYFCISKSSF